MADERFIFDSANVKLKFASIDEFRAYLEAELAYISSSLRPHRNDLNGAVDRVYGPASQRLRAVLNVLTGQNGQPPNSDAAASQFQDFLRDSGFPVAGSADRQFLDELRENRGTAIAAAAWVALAGVGGQDLSGMEGYIRFHLHQAGATPAVAANARKKLTSTEREYRNTIEALQRELDDFTRQAQTAQAEKLATLERLIEEHQSRGQRMAVVARRMWRKGLASAKKRNEQARQTLQDAEDLFLKKLQLSSAVAYWGDKSASHHRAARRYAFGISAYLFLAAGIAVWHYPSIFARISTLGPEVHWGVFAFIGATGLLGATVALWIARILVRLYMSEHHLAIDAKERSIMVQTYLALSQDKKVEDKDVEKLLLALFRPTADGIVKDDGGPDLGLAAVISKAIDKIK